MNAELMAMMFQEFAAVAAEYTELRREHDDVRGRLRALRIQITALERHIRSTEAVHGLSPRAGG